MIFRACSLLLILAYTISADIWQLRSPLINDQNKHVESDHLALWYDESISLNDSVAYCVLRELENILDFHLCNTVFGESFLFSSGKYKINCFIAEDHKSCESYEELGHPVICLNTVMMNDRRLLAHEFYHSLQAVSGRFRSKPYVEWFRGCQAFWLTQQIYPEEPGGEKSNEDDLQVKANVISGTVTVTVNCKKSGSASLELMDIGGRILFNSTINGDATFSIPARVYQKVLLWKISNCEIQKNGIVMADR